MSSADYESSELLNQYLLFHYGPADAQLPWPDGPHSALDFPARCVSEGVDRSRLPERARALDLGCSVGRSTFELAALCADVTGIDFSASFIRAAERMRSDGPWRIAVPRTGLLTEQVELRRPPQPSGSLRFLQGDAQQLPADIGSFDVLLAANLLCRLPRPQQLIERLPGLVATGGQLIFTTPNTWMETFTPPQFWIGGTEQTGEPLDALHGLLADHFTLDASWDMPFLIREHARKFQWSVASASRWIRR
jgi:putative 4-mercaptohistidine N1-methyltranferase